MIRVAWRLERFAWLGGLNYFRNLMKALAMSPDSRIEPVLLGEKSQEEFSFEFIPYRLPQKFSWGWLYRHFSHFVSKRDFALENLLRENHVDLLSHYVPLGSRSSVSSLCWIPDLQHKKMPEMFSAKERFLRDRSFLDMARNAQGVLFSSESAKKDFQRAYPRVNPKTRVLPFVAWVSEIPPAEAAQILAKYNIDEPYFHVPNQLWRHKNHQVILEALKIAGNPKEAPLVISTGDTGDYRHLQYFEELRCEVNDAGLKERFRFLGRIPPDDLMALMKCSLALVNPSYFEGWSTTVEEGKSMGKTVILSDIPVHREQAPERGRFFRPDRPEELYEVLRDVAETHNPDRENNEYEKAMKRLPERMRQYAASYENIVLDVLQDE
ncbi:MAG: glycosyltransferase family 4 protein, partial [Synergistaceae bacterium]|nr:glycosyltransferase family 4 protein [Synergistaceae bacterium]